MKFCQKLKLLREERNMNITEFATLLGTSKQVISRYEKGENVPKITTVANYAKILNVSVEYLMSDDATDNENIGDGLSQKIKDLRLKRGMTLEQVGNIVGVGKSTVRKWETGMIANMKSDKIALLAQALGTTPAYLMDWETKPMTTPAERIKLLIEQSGLSYQELEKKTGVKKSSLQRYASGTTVKIPLDVFEKLSITFNIPQEYLMGLSDGKKETFPKAIPLSVDQNILKSRKAFGARIKFRRKELGMSADKLAEILGKDRSTVYRYEKGDIENLPLDILDPMAKALKTTPSRLMGWEEMKANAPEELVLSEGEKTLIDLFRKLPEEAQRMYLAMLHNSLKNQR